MLNAVSHSTAQLVSGVRTPYLEAGDIRSTEAVVFVHGNPGSGQDWGDLLDRAGGFARAVAPDMPGFGQAEKSEHFNYTVGGYAAHLGAFLDALDIRRAHLVLHDFGGPWGLAWAAAHPQAVASLSLINTGYVPGYRWHFAARIWRLPGIGELFQRLTTRRAFHALMRLSSPRRPLPEAFVERMFQDYDQGTRSAVLKLYRATDIAGLARELAPGLRELHCPVMVIWGKRDLFLPYRYAFAQRELFPDAEIELLPDSGHFPYADDPQGVAQRLIPFLRRAVAPATAASPTDAAASP
jgi:pimeloyl-ACP methyl ester carboxylesterase